MSWAHRWQAYCLSHTTYSSTPYILVPHTAVFFRSSWMEHWLRIDSCLILTKMTTKNCPVSPQAFLHFRTKPCTLSLILSWRFQVMNTLLQFSWNFCQKTLRSLMAGLKKDTCHASVSIKPVRYICLYVGICRIALDLESRRHVNSKFCLKLMAVAEFFSPILVSKIPLEAIFPLLWLIDQ